MIDQSISHTQMDICSYFLHLKKPWNEIKTKTIEKETVVAEKRNQHRNELQQSIRTATKNNKRRARREKQNTGPTIGGIK